MAPPLRTTYPNIYISEDEYINRYLKNHIPYYGFVIGIGFAWSVTDTSFPTTNNKTGKRFYDKYCPTFFIQRLDTSLYMAELSLNIRQKDLEMLIMKDTMSNTVTIRHNRGGTIYTHEYPKKDIKVELEDTGTAIMVRYSYGQYERPIVNCRLKDFIDKVLYEEHGYRDMLPKVGSLKFLKNESQVYSATYSLVEHGKIAEIYQGLKISIRIMPRI